MLEHYASLFEFVDREVLSACLRASVVLLNSYNNVIC
jgi:hypothetical protein